MGNGKRIGARDRLRKHFLSNVGRVMNADELREVSGIYLNGQEESENCGVRRGIKSLLTMIEAN